MGSKSATWNTLTLGTFSFTLGTSTHLSADFIPAAQPSEIEESMTPATVHMALV